MALPSSIVTDNSGKFLRLFAAMLAIVNGSLAIIGWVCNYERLTDWTGDGISMFPNTALCAILVGVALLSASRTRTALRWISRCAAVAVVLIAGLTLAEHIFGWDVGIDTLVFTRDWGQRAAAAPMRMGPPAATSFLLLGLSLVLAMLGASQRRVASGLVIFPAVISALSLTGYWFGADELFGIAHWTGIALQTSAIVAFLSAGVMAAIPEYGIAAALERKDAEGAVLRRLIAPIIFVPLFLGWLRILGQDAGLYDVAFGTALRTIVEVILLLVLLWWAARSIGQLSHAAQQANAKVAAIVESSDDAIISKSLDGIIQSWNPGAEQVFGYTANEAIGKHITLIIPSDRLDEETDILSRLRRGEPIDHFETIRVRKDGKRINISLTVSPIRDAVGNIVGASKIARDVTAQKEAETVVRENEAQLRKIADSIPQLAWMAEADGQVAWFNQRWFEYTGTTFEQMKGWGWQAVHDPSVLPAVVQNWKRSLETAEPFEMEFPLRRADGAFRWFLTRANPLRNEQGHVVRWFGTCTDVDRVKRIEQQLREQTHTLELLNESGTAIASTLETDSLLQAVTDIGTKLSGAKFGAFFYNAANENGDAYLLFTLAGAPREAFEKFGNPRATPLFGPTFIGSGPIRCDDVLKDPRYGQMGPHHGQPAGHLPVRSYLAVPVVSPTKEVFGGLFFGHPEVGVFTEQVEGLIVGIAAQAALAIDNARLYSDLKRAANERSQLLDAERVARSVAERASVMKDEFLANLSHELRTPLNAIYGWSQLLMAGNMPEEDRREGYAAIHRNAKTQTQLIEDLLDMNRIIAGKVRLDVQPVDLANIIDAAVDSVRPAAEAKQIRLRKVLDPRAGPVSGDPTRLQQIVWNLLSNAIKFTPKEGKVDVLLERVNSHVEITVTDSGMGINPEFLPIVFERFRQADASTTRVHGGLGLGLSIVKNLVELHGGIVEVQSAGEGKGATFTVKLPLAPVRDAANREHPTTPNIDVAKSGELGLAGVKVLVVDDEPDARNLIQQVLQRCHAEVTTAESSDQAISLLRRHRPDVIVSDIGMPNKDGYQFIREVRALSATEGGKTPAIALTAYARSEDRTRAMLAGFQVHISKPIEPTELIATVGNVAGRTTE
jgi:PAS domain S-box-containing protein